MSKNRYFSFIFLLLQTMNNRAMDLADFLNKSEQDCNLFNNEIFANFLEIQEETEMVDKIDVDSENDPMLKKNLAIEKISRKEQVEKAQVGRRRKKKTIYDTNKNSLLIEKFKLEKKIQCTRCDRRFWSEMTLRKHKNVHEAGCRWTCQCGQIFSCKTSLKMHQVCHDEVRPFSCDKCSKAFKTKIHLNQRKNIHDEKRFFCPYLVCDYKAHFIHHVKSHLSKKHRDDFVNFLELHPGSDGYDFINYVCDNYM